MYIFLLGLLVGIAGSVVGFSLRAHWQSRRIAGPGSKQLDVLGSFPEPLALSEAGRLVFRNAAWERAFAIEAKTLNEWKNALAPEAGLEDLSHAADLAGNRVQGSLQTKDGRYWLWIASPYQALGRRLVLHGLFDASFMQPAEGMADLSNFMNHAAHELKTPITAIKGYSELMAMYIKDGRPVQIEMITKVVMQTNRLVHLIDQLLDVTRLAAGTFVEEPQVIDTCGQLQSIIEKIQREFPGREIKLACEARGLSIDPRRLENVVRELVFNALQYSEKAVVVRFSTGEQLARIEVADQGIGISPDDHEKVFQRFGRAGNASQAPHGGGFGLGLYLTQSIVARWKGKVWLESTLGQGTRAVAEWPCRDGAPKHQFEEVSPRPNGPDGRRPSSTSH